MLPDMNTTTNRTMYRFAYFLLLALLPALSQAQVNNKSVRQKLLDAPLYVLLDEEFGTTYNEAISYAVQNYWTLSPVEFIEKKQMDELKLDINNVFLLKIEDEGIDGDTRSFKDQIKIAHFARGGRYRNNITGSPILLGDEEESKRDMVHALRLLQDKVRFEMEKQEAGYKDYAAYLWERRDDLEVPTLYIARNDLGIDKEDVPKYFDGKVELVTKRELWELIESDQRGFAYVLVSDHGISGGKVYYKEIVEAGSGEILFHSYGGGEDFGKKEFKMLGW